MKTRLMTPWNVCPEVPPPEGMGRARRFVWLALEGYPRLAADTILDRGVQGKLVQVTREAIDEFERSISEHPGSSARCYEALVEAGLNLAGMERKRAGFSEEEAGKAFEDIVMALRRWGSAQSERADETSRSVTGRMLEEMKKVLMGQSMVAKMGEELADELDDDDILASFLLGARRMIQNNVYFQIVDGGMSKIGNDSATGLRWLRHLGAVQVSSNPVIAARAYEETPELWQRFEAVAAGHPEWGEDPERFADEAALFGTVTSLLPNVLDFRPIALLSDFRDGMVSIQLNPFKAASTEGSKEDAMKISGILQGILKPYDECLNPESLAVGGRPNVVFKVASSSAAAVETTRRLNEVGIGTNNTVTFTAAQEVSVVIAAGLGLLRAMKSGTPIGRVYVTNMEGRLEDHIREAEATRMLLERMTQDGGVGDKMLTMAERVGAGTAFQKAVTAKEKAAILCSKKHLKSLTDGWFVEALGLEKPDSLEQTETDVRMAGILVTRRVYRLGFAPENSAKLAAYLAKKAGVSEREARTALGMVDLLPASKRRAEDTVLVLGAKGAANLTNTEFPDQQLKVWTRARETGFRISDYEGSIDAPSDEACLERLLKIEDFDRAYNLTPELGAELASAGIGAGEAGGLAPDDWSSYGPVVKTMHEFEDAYSNFKGRLLGRIGRSRTERQL